MKKQKIILSLFLSASLMIATLAAFAEVGPTYAIIHCTVVPVNGPPVENGVIIIRDGLIESVGVFGDITIPDDAEVIEAGEMYAYPGLISAHTNLLLEPSSPPSQTQREASSSQLPDEEPGWQKSELMAFEKLLIKTTTIEDLYKAGITTVLVAPEQNIFAGQSVILNLRGENKEAMVLKQPFALHINFVTARGEYPSSLMGTMALLRQSFLDTEHYFLYKEQFAKSPSGLKRPEHNPFLESLLPYVIKKDPIIFNCANIEDIKRAIRLIQEFKLNGTISGANEAWRVVDWIKKANLPLLVSLDYRPPNMSKYVRQGDALKKEAEENIYPANAANLHKNGVKFALTSLGLSKSADVLKNLRTVIKSGFPEDEALKAMTIYPAEYLGIKNLVGSLEPGKIANVVLTTGKIFDEKTVVQKIFVDGLSFEVKQPPKKAESTSLDISGKWKAVVDSPMGAMDMTIEFIQDGSNITGSFTSEMGKWNITDGILNGKELTFSISANIMGESMSMEFSGTVDNESLEGNISVQGENAKLKATKIPNGGVEENLL
ncbi:MAG: amidohydrolase family protein [Candidatus Aminicenantes bacterium]|nr:amidohydrolase family protein [Candidatus Aminicenantes bacterium]